MKRIKLNDSFFLEGTAFDWKLIRRVPGKDKDGNEKMSEKVHYFGRLAHIVEHIINEEAKGASTLKEMYNIIHKTNADILAVLGEVAADKKLAEYMKQAGENGDAEEIEKPANVANPRRRSRKKTGTDATA